MKIGRNAPCPCGSGKKFKKCCIDKTELFVPKTEYWSKEEVELMSTSDITAKLGFINIPFDKEQFLRDIRVFQSAEDLSEMWFETCNVSAVGFDEDFPWFAAWELWNRLGEDELPCDEELDVMIDKGYALIEEDRLGEACDLWLSQWNVFTQKYENYRDIGDTDSVYKGDNIPSNWCQDIEMNVMNTGWRESSRFFKLGIGYCRSFVERFPESDELMIKNMLRAEAEAYFMIGKVEEGEKRFQEIIKAYPRWIFGYVGWGDMYAFGDGVPVNHKKAKEIYNMALNIELDDHSDDGVLEERLEALEE